MPPVFLALAAGPHRLHPNAGAVGDPGPPRTNADSSPRRCLAAAKRGRRRSHPARPAHSFFTGGGVPPPPPQRGCRVGAPARRDLTLTPSRGFPCPRLGVAAGASVLPVPPIRERVTRPGPSFTQFSPSARISVQNRPEIARVLQMSCGRICAGGCACRAAFSSIRRPPCSGCPGGRSITGFAKESWRRCTRGVDRSEC
jgi:hypothetical protein